MCFVEGTHELPAGISSFSANLLEEVRFGPEQELGEPEAPGLFEVIRIPTDCNQTTYRYNYRQRFTLPGGERLEVKIFGGGKILATMTDIGAQNIDFVRRFLADEGIAIAGEDVGATYPRKIYYFAQTGKVLLKKIEVLHNDTIERREREYLDELTQKPVSGDIELF